LVGDGPDAPLRNCKKQNLPIKGKQQQFVDAAYLPLVGPSHQNIIGKELLLPISSSADFRLILQ
jgi:hypothetical protein